MGPMKVKDNISNVVIKVKLINVAQKETYKLIIQLTDLDTTYSTSTFI
jgi:hypothetical protein